MTALPSTAFRPSKILEQKQKTNWNRLVAGDAKSKLQVHPPRISEQEDGEAECCSVEPVPCRRQFAYELSL